MTDEDEEFNRIERESEIRLKAVAATIQKRVIVPDAIHHTDLSKHPEYISGWNDCRALMLGGQL